MSTTPTISTPASVDPASEPGLPAAGFHLPSYLLGLITACILLGAALFFWPRPQPAALQLQPPPTPAATPTVTPLAAAAPAATPSPLVVFVSGAVVQPGLYTLGPNARIGDALAAAGGLLAGVDPALINQAQPLIDGAQLHIPAPTAPPIALSAASEPASEPVSEPPASAQAGAAVDPTESAPAAAQPPSAPTGVQPPAGLSAPQAPALPTPTAPAAAGAPARSATVELGATGALMNVNTASGSELESLPGIGPAKAQAIIANRPYASVEELDRVPGIGPATLEQIRLLVTVQ